MRANAVTWMVKSIAPLQIDCTIWNLKRSTDVIFVSLKCDAKDRFKIIFTSASRSYSAGNGNEPPSPGGVCGRENTLNGK